jgi:hypothetical protein
LGITFMFKLLFKLLALVFLLLALGTGIIDITRSIADSVITITPLGEYLGHYFRPTLNLSQALVQRYIHPAVWDPVIQWILLAPTWLVCGVLALIFGFFGRRVKKRWQDQYGA